MAPCSKKRQEEALETLWCLAKEAEINTDELLLAQSMVRFTAFLFAAAYNFVGTLNRMWDCAEETHLNPKSKIMNCYYLKIFLDT